MALELLWSEAKAKANAETANIRWILLPDLADLVTGYLASSSAVYWFETLLYERDYKKRTALARELSKTTLPELGSFAQRICDRLVAYSDTWTSESLQSCLASHFMFEGGITCNRFSCYWNEKKACICDHPIKR